MDQKLILSRGKTKGKEYYVNPVLLKAIGYKGRTNLKQIESHRLSELIIQDLTKFPDASFPDIHDRIGKEISSTKIRKELKELINKGIVKKEGGRKYASYHLVK